MDNDILMLYGAAHAVSILMNKGSHAYAKKDKYTGKWVTVDWADIYDYLTDLIDKYEEGEADE